jgi:TatD DNase family protein
MIDTHAHVHASAFDADRAAVLERAFAAGLRALLEVSIDAARWPRARELARSDPRIYLTVGIHPHDTGGATAEELEALLGQTGDPRVRAIGETGLDYYRDYAPHEKQREFFARHVAAARETGLPLVVHSRERRDGPSAHQDVLRILREEGRGRVRGVLHCFSGDLEVARAADGLGFLLGIGGAITYDPKRSRPLLASIARALGTSVFVLETDCPYLTPHPHRNKRNEPANVPAIAEALAGALGLPRDEVERITDENAAALFRLEG